MHASKNAENQANMVKFKNEFKPLLRQKYPKSRRECLDDKSGTGGQAVVEMPVLKNRQKLSQGMDFRIFTQFFSFETFENRKSYCVEWKQADQRNVGRGTFEA